MKQITVLGSTGSIGTQTLDIIRNQTELGVAALAAYKNIDLLEKQIREFSPEIACVYQEEGAKRLRNRVKDLSVKIVTGMEGLYKCATISKAETVVAAMVGMIGIRPTIEAIKAGKQIALANKETLVTAGHIIMPLVKEYNVDLLPVDSEHCAIFQAMQGEDKKSVNKIILTASGGPFRGRNRDELKKITPEEALKHPNWSMGSKITIDSATMVNKGLEVMEAKWLFDLEPDQIDVVVHPQSVIHSMVEYIDGSVIAQMGTPDMRLPIQYALFYPNRKKLIGGKSLNFYQMNQLTFEEPDMVTFTGLKFGIDACKIGGSLPTVYNAANEWAVARFLEGKISYLDISTYIEEAMKHHTLILNPTLNEILKTELETYDFVRELSNLK